jgi:predicted solute-binding protein
VLNTVLRGYDALMQTIEATKIRIGVVNFFNATPLIDGIFNVDEIALVPKVPSELVGCLDSGEVDLALASSIDYQKSTSELGIIPVGVLSSDGESLTVKLCSRVPFDEVTSVHCDTDSHTSVALMQIILKEVFDITPQLIDVDIRSLGKCNSEWAETVLIIGDKVITSECDGEYPFSLDLGLAWKEQYELPFVFATWFAKTNVSESKVRIASMILERQLAFNQQRLEQVVSANAFERGWTNSLAFDYVTKHMNYAFTDAHLASLTLFYDLAEKYGVVEKNRPICFLNK